MSREYTVLWNGTYADFKGSKIEAEERAGEWMAYLLDTPYGLQDKAGSVWDNLYDWQHTDMRVVAWKPHGERPIWCQKCRKLIPRKRWSGHYQRFHGGCVHCHSSRLVDIPGNTYDRDGIRNAKRCLRCGTEMKSFAHGYGEKTADEYVGKLPDYLQSRVNEAFDREARARGYHRAEDCRSLRMRNAS